MPEKEFVANGVIAGGINCFKIVERQTYSDFFNQNDEFEFEKYDIEVDKQGFIENKQYVFGKDSNWCSSELNLQIKFKLDLFLEGYIDLKDLDFYCYISIYQKGFSSAIFWIDMNKEKLNYSQIVEIISIVNAGFSKATNRHISAHLKNKKVEFSSFPDLLKTLQRVIHLGFETKLNKLNDDSYVYPITYILEVPDCNCSDDIIKKYGEEIVGLCDAWTNYHHFFKQNEIDRIINTDLHPFKYGVSIYTNSGMVELHPTNFKELQEVTKYSPTLQHFYERVFLYIICEISILHLFVLVWYNKRITQAANKSFSFKLNFLSFLKELKNLNKLYHTTTGMISLFNEVPFIRKSYITHTIDNINNIIGVNKLSEILLLKLNDIKQQMSLAFTIVTSIFVIILTILSLLFSIYQIVIAF